MLTAANIPSSAPITPCTRKAASTHSGRPIQRFAHAPGGSIRCLCDAVLLIHRHTPTVRPGLREAPRPDPICKPATPVGVRFVMRAKTPLGSAQGSDRPHNTMGKRPGRSTTRHAPCAHLAWGRACEPHKCGAPPARLYCKRRRVGSESDHPVRMIGYSATHTDASTDLPCKIDARSIDAIDSVDRRVPARSLASPQHQSRGCC